MIAERSGGLHAWVGPLALAALLGATGGCASGGLGASAADRARRELAARGLDPQSVVVPFETDEEMRRWAHDRVPSYGRPLERLQVLLTELLRRDGSPIGYERGSTATAREVWASGAANCLSCTHLFVGLARELDLPVYYLRVSDLSNYQREGDLAIASEHVVAAYGPPTRRHVLDFSDRPVLEYRDTQRISDLTAIALYYSNLGANQLRAGRSEEALDSLTVATRVDPELVDGWVNRGVALRRLGSYEEAERSYRRALEVDPRAVVAYNNLASLLGQLGRANEAARLLALTDRASNRNPFSYLALGDLALGEGRFAEAERFYRRALRLHPGQAEPLAAIGQAALAAGDRREAERWLRKARRAGENEPRVARLERALAGAAGSGEPPPAAPQPAGPHDSRRGG